MYLGDKVVAARHCWAAQALLLAHRPRRGAAEGWRPPLQLLHAGGGNERRSNLALLLLWVILRLRSPLHLLTRLLLIRPHDLLLLLLLHHQRLRLLR